MSKIKLTLTEKKKYGTVVGCGVESSMDKEKYAWDSLIKQSQALREECSNYRKKLFEAESELTSLKQRIDGITVEDLMDIIKSPLYTYRQFEDTNGYLTKIIKTVIFDDGRLKQLAVAIHDKIKGVVK